MQSIVLIFWGVDTVGSEIRAEEEEEEDFCFCFCGDEEVEVGGCLGAHGLLAFDLGPEKDF